jgi:hypothetical protein
MNPCDQPADWEALLESIDGDPDFASELVLLFTAKQSQENTRAFRPSRTG